MFGIGWTEIMAIGVIGLLVLGPDDLPKVARQVGQGYQWLKQITTEARSLLAKDLDLGNDTLRDTLNDMSYASQVIKSAANASVADAKVVHTVTVNDRGDDQ